MTASPEPRSRAGLALRIWVGCLAGVTTAAAGAWWSVSSVLGMGEPFDVNALILRLVIAFSVGAVAGLGFGLWLSRGVINRVRRMARSVGALDAAPLHDPFAVRGWGELSDLRAQVAALITRHRQAARAADQMQLLERQLDDARYVLERWAETERWAALPPSHGPARALIEALNRGFARQAEVLEQNQEAARQVQSEIGSAIADAREAAEEAERGFVEATSLLTTIRELQRLGGELQALVSGAQPEQPPAAPADWLAPAAEVIEELLRAATESIDHLASGLDRVQELAENVHVLGNRSTLIALNTLIAGSQREGEVASETPSSEDLKQLAREARAATDRVHVLAREIEADVEAASTRMKGLRERIGERLTQLAPKTSQAEALPATELARVLDRVREMVQDATAKAERTSAAGEHASRAAHRLIQRLDEEVRDIEGLVVRLSPPDALGSPIRSQSAPPRFRVVDIEVHEDMPSSSEEQQ